MTEQSYTKRLGDLQETFSVIEGEDGFCLFDKERGTILTGSHLIYTDRGLETIIIDNYYKTKQTAEQVRDKLIYSAANIITD